MSEEILNTQEIEAFFFNLKIFLDSYDFSNLKNVCEERKKKGRKATADLPSLGNPISSPEELQIEMNDYIQQIKNAHEQGKVALLIGPYRAGKTTLLLQWLAEKDLDINSLIDCSWNTIPGPNNEVSQLVLDELKSDSATVSAIKSLQEIGTRLILSTDLKYVEDLKKEMEEQGISYHEILLTVAQTDLKKYVASILHLEENDELVFQISELSGGSHFIAGHISVKLIEELIYSETEPKKVLVTALEKVRFQFSGIIESWNDQRNNSGKLAHLVPNPLVFDPIIRKLS